MKDPSATGHGPLGATVLRGVGLSTVGFLVNQILVFAVYLVLARLVSPVDFGALAAGMVVVGAGLLFAESGMLAAIVHREHGVEEAANTGLIATILAGAGLALGALAVAPLLGAFFHRDMVRDIAAAGSGLILLRSAAVVPDALMRRRFSVARRTVIDPLSTLAMAVVSIALCAAGAGAWGLLAGFYASATTAMVMTWALARWRPRPRLASFRTWREMAGYGRHVIWTEVLYRVAAEIDALIIGRLLGTAALGQFRYATRVALRPLAALSDTVSFVLFPALARMSEDSERFSAALLRALRWSTFIAIPVAMLLLPLGEPLMILVFGSRWEPAGEALTVLCGVAAGQSLISISGEAFKAVGRPELMARVQLVTTVCTILFALAMAPFGLVAVAAAFSVAAVTGGLVALMLICRATSISARGIRSHLLPQVIAAGLVASGILALDRTVLLAASHDVATGITIMVLETVLGAVAYVFALGLTAPEMREDGLGLLREARSAARRGRVPAG